MTQCNSLTTINISVPNKNTILDDSIPIYSQYKNSHPLKTFNLIYDYITGTPPTIISVTHLSNKLTVKFAASIGGTAPIAYLYSLDGGDYTDTNTAGNTFEITIPTENVAKSHSVKMIARNPGGDTEPSASFIVVPPHKIEMKSLFTDNSKVFYKPGSLSCGVGSTKNYRHKSNHT